MGERPSRFLCLGNLMKIKRADFKEASFKPSSCEAEQFCGGLCSEGGEKQKGQISSGPQLVPCIYFFKYVSGSFALNV